MIASNVKEMVRRNANMEEKQKRYSNIFRIYQRNDGTTPGGLTSGQKAAFLALAVDAKAALDVANGLVDACWVTEAVLPPFDA